MKVTRRGRGRRARGERLAPCAWGVLVLALVVLGGGTHGTALAEASLDGGAPPRAIPSGAAKGAASGDRELLGPPPLAPPLPLAALDEKLGKLGSARPEERRAAAKAITDLGGEATDALGRALARLANAPDDALGSALRDARRAQREGGGDLLEGCVRLDPNAPGAHDALAAVTLLRALAHTDAIAAGPPLVAAAWSHGGALRDEASRDLAALGDPAIPALIEAEHDPSHATEKWATELLESMNDRTAADAVQVKRIDVLEAVLATYAKVHDEGAVPAVLAFATSDRPRVRAAARASLRAYGATAVPRLREEFQNLTSLAAPPEWDAARLADELFAAEDRAALADVKAMLDAAVRAAADAGDDEGKLAAAVADFDKVLARAPDMARKGEMVPGYVHYAQILEPKDSAKARDLFERAVRLDPEGHRADQARSAIAYLDAADLEAKGVIDRAGYARAASLDPGNTRARDALARIDAADAARSARVRTWVGGAAAVVVILAFAILFVPWRRRG